MKHRTAVITGATRGIGRAIAIEFAKEGYDVVLNYNHSDGIAGQLAKELTRDYGSLFGFIKADVGDSLSVNKMMAEVLRRFGRIDVLVNNAGISQQKLFTDITDQDWNAMISTNVTGVFNCCRAVLPHMIQRKSGCIVNISSMWGQVGGSCEVHYSAAKAAVIGLTKALAKEVGPSGIRVNCIAPGVIQTDMNSHLSPSDLNALKDETPLGTIGAPEDISKMAAYLASASASFITGQIIGVNGGIVI